MKIKHYSFFNDTQDELNWEFLRNNPNESAYYIPEDKASYLQLVDIEHPSNFVKNIITFCHKNNITNVFSIGSGRASIEFQIKKFSNLNVTISDNNESVFKIKNFNLFDKVLKFDAFTDKIPTEPNTLVIFPRIDTEFSDEDLNFIFKKFHQSNTDYILFIPAELLSLKILMAEFKILIFSIIKSKKRIFCGYARTYNAFKKIWTKYYINIDEQNFNKSFILKSNA